MPLYCVVPLCKNSGGHKFPANKTLELKWRVAIKRIDPVSKQLWKPGKYSVVCSQHFVESDYRPLGLLGEKKRLKLGAVPSIFTFQKENVPINLERAERSSKRLKLQEPVESTPDISFLNVHNIETVPFTDISNDKGIQCFIPDAKSKESDDVPPVNLLKQFCYIDQVKESDNALQYYTGFDNFEHFMLIFNVLGPAVHHIYVKKCSLSPVDQFLLVLMKLRQAKDDSELSLFFKISTTTVSCIINTWINFLYFQLNEINIWPNRDLVDLYMPANFGKLFKSTRVILDATEIPIQKPQNVESQSATFSTYKNKNTLKTMIGITPRGLTSFISDSYGGSASDRQIIERSTLVTSGKDLFDKKDSIMAHRGIAAQDLFANIDVKVNTPHFLKGKSQLEPEEVVQDRRIASKRIHVERVIGYAKTFKILQKPLVHSKVAMGSRIVNVCFMLCNFRSCIVGNMA